MENIDINTKKFEQFRFIDKEVYSDTPLLIEDKESKLKKGLKVSINLGGKVKIRFLNQFNKLYRVESRIQAITEKYVVIFGNRLIPKRAIVDVDFH